MLIRPNSISQRGDRAEVRREQAQSGIYTREDIMKLDISEKERQELLNLLKQAESEKEKSKVICKQKRVIKKRTKKYLKKSFHE